MSIIIQCDAVHGAYDDVNNDVITTECDCLHWSVDDDTSPGGRQLYYELTVVFDQHKDITYCHKSISMNLVHYQRGIISQSTVSFSQSKHICVCMRLFMGSLIC